MSSRAAIDDASIPYFCKAATPTRLFSTSIIKKIKKDEHSVLLQGSHPNPFVSDINEHIAAPIKGTVRDGGTTLSDGTFRSHHAPDDVK
jgi:hypothetical protein